MSVSDAQYQAWLAADGRQRVLLAEAVAYSAGAEQTRYMATAPFVSAPSDTPANTAYDDILASVPFIYRAMSEAFAGHTTISWGDLEIANESGVRDAWLADAWDARAVRLYLGDPAWPKADFRLILDGAIADLGATGRKLVLKIADKTHLLNRPIQTTLIGGSLASAGQPLPLAFGQCFNVEPVLVDAATSTYQVHDGAIEDITDVRDNGISLGGAGFTKDLANGKFSLTAAPAGRITADVKGAKPAGAWLTKTADIVSHLAQARAGLAAGDLDAASFSAFATACPQTVGVYLRERVNLIDVLDQLVTSVGGWYGFARSGKLQLGRLEAPVGSPVLRLVADDVRQWGVSIKRRQLPRASVRLAYARNWTPQADGLAGAVTEAARALYAAEHQVAVAADAAVKTAHPLAEDPDVAPALLASSADAAAEAARRLALHGVVRTTFEVSAFAAPFQVGVGDVIELDHSRFGFAGGALARVVGIREEPTRARMTLELWR